MAVTVGTNVYDTLANTDAYWLERANTDWAALDTADKEVYMIKATDWIDREFRFRGKKSTEDQRLSWPRDLAYDDDGYQVGEDGAPLKVKEAMYIMADIFRDGTYDLEGILVDDVAVTKEKVDVIEVEYDAAARLRGGSVMTHIYALLGPMVTANSLLRA
jgi:hypothetical protein